MHLPIPEPAPVTSAILPSRRMKQLRLPVGKKASPRRPAGKRPPFAHAKGRPTLILPSPQNKRPCYAALPDRPQFCPLIEWALLWLTIAQRVGSLGSTAPDK